MGWREMLVVVDEQPPQPESAAQNPQNSPVCTVQEHSADCADSAHGVEKKSDDEQHSRLMEQLGESCKGLEITPAELLDALAPEDIEEWKQGDLNGDVLTAFANLLVDQRLIEQGKRPPHYTEKGHCQQCGPVYLWSSESVLGCPWCFNRAADKPIPRPGSVRCGECRHFERIRQPYSHPHLGHCAVGEPEAIAGLWDSDRRYCLRYLPLKTEIETKEQKDGK